MADKREARLRNMGLAKCGRFADGRCQYVAPCRSDALRTSPTARRPRVLRRNNERSGQDSNPRHLVPKTSALSTELPEHACRIA